MKKRNLFEELMAGVQDMANEREGKLTLRTSKVKLSPEPVTITAEEIQRVRGKAWVSQAIMARSLRVNPRTYQNWEQGVSRPNAQAAVLLKLVDQDPTLFARISALV
ncbi:MULTISPECIES: transcriptional regulator [unclassified Herbaspirillum]|uniref:helix-turn-helix domain-containing protein n=1 Tax=unclassified Herbaspirillum TaxID=2624150 RepID=UPI000C0A18A2|nr:MULTISPECIES: transcriptional regulator [unclassified Herbaspirillum]MAF04910.1 transcriptional regulator [Herbaspirillum sp.]MBO14612.1 transcriptional regulator [Herbaspirillum sp.]|tara:strand:- start:1768 stop:2088 length:321 start_codon:yes stop_codon:yes gene_type:complete